MGMDISGAKNYNCLSYFQDILYYELRNYPSNKYASQTTSLIVSCKFYSSKGFEWDL